MPGPFTIKGKIDGLEDALRSIQHLKESARNRLLKPAVDKASRILAKAAKQQAPQESGLLKKSIGSKVVVYSKAVVGIIGPRKGFRKTVAFVLSKRGSMRARILKPGQKAPAGAKTEIRDPVKYAHLVENGRKQVTVLTRKVLANGRAIFGRTVRPAKGKAFMRKAFDQNKNAARDAMIRTIAEGLARLKAKGKA